MGTGEGQIILLDLGSPRAGRAFRHRPRHTLGQKGVRRDPRRGKRRQFPSGHGLAQGVSAFGAYARPPGGKNPTRAARQWTADRFAKAPRGGPRIGPNGRASREFFIGEGGHKQRPYISVTGASVERPAVSFTSRLGKGTEGFIWDESPRGDQTGPPRAPPRSGAGLDREERLKKRLARFGDHGSGGTLFFGVGVGTQRGTFYPQRDSLGQTIALGKIKTQKCRGGFLGWWGSRLDSSVLVSGNALAPTILGSLGGGGDFDPGRISKFSGPETGATNNGSRRGIAC